jgi:hypothetical protein
LLCHNRVEKLAHVVGPHPHVRLDRLLCDFEVTGEPFRNGSESVPIGERRLGRAGAVVDCGRDREDHFLEGRRAHDAHSVGRRALHVQ